MIVSLIILLLLYETIIQFKKKKNTMRDFPSGPVAKTPNSQCGGGSGSIPGQATRLHMPQIRVHILQLKSCLL